MPNYAQIKVLPYNSVVCGANKLSIYLPHLKSKQIAVVTNSSGQINGTSIIDTLLKLKINVKKVFCPEHGFRGEIEAGEKVNSEIDNKTQLPIISLYGKNKKPTNEQLQNIDVVVFDIQDVGVRFYTYISTLSYVMEACAENKKELIVLDRPNPNGFYIDGPILQNSYKSFLGLHPVPIVYGLTIGEYAKMVNGEKWLKNGLSCNLKIITIDGYRRNCSYQLPIKPSPNLPNNISVLLYPSLGLFEGTIVSLARGTDMPFQAIGHPNFKDTTFYFTPRETKLSANPKYKNLKCFGIDLRNSSDSLDKKINLTWLQYMYNQLTSVTFFDKNFNFHAGDSLLQKYIKENKSEREIRASWKQDIEKYKVIRKKYLLYKDF